jgi:hypothetical protein
MPTPVENFIPKNSRKLLIRLFGTSLSFTLEVGGDDFSDNNERPDKVVAKSRGTVYAMIDGPDPDARTGSFTVDFFTKNNGLAVAFLDVINGYNGAEDWSGQSTGQVGAPYIERYALDMEVTVLGAAQDGGDWVRTYRKVVFEETYTTATDKNTVSVNWSCYGGVTETGPTAAP